MDSSVLVKLFFFIKLKPYCTKIEIYIGNKFYNCKFLISIVSIKVFIPYCLQSKHLNGL